MAQRSPFGQSLKRRHLAVETSLVAMCCVCGLVRAPKTLTGAPDQWVTKRAYEQMYGNRIVGNPVTHSYCSGCHADFMQRVRPSGQTLTP